MYCIFRILYGVIYFWSNALSVPSQIDTEPLHLLVRFLYGLLTLVVFTILFMRYLRVATPGSWKAIRYILLFQMFTLSLSAVFLLLLSTPQETGMVELEKTGAPPEVLVFFLDSAISLFWYLIYNLSGSVRAYYQVLPERSA